ncbi:MAG: acetyl-CoA decarbonylase/synthase complex subunit delta [Candidatus Gastranaerophilales bacterium]|nr:acetyl-CoA decarbonylase/synthase complex subunit delta [Candidatus Gastranaerophilales bacterium]
MDITYNVPVKDSKVSIRQVKLGNLILGGETSLPFMHKENKFNSKPLVALEIQTILPDKYSNILQEAWGNCINDAVLWAKKAEEKQADVLVVRFNIANCDNHEQEINKSKDQLRKILSMVSIPVIVIGSDREEIDIVLLPELAKVADKECSFGFVDEDNYKDIIPILKEYGHNVIARTPIDINLAKELNILITEMGFDPDKIIIDPNMGALGYGIDYAYSVIERIRLAAFDGDTMLNMPISTFIGIETWKTKEAKSENVPDEWGNIKTRAISWECITASSMITAGADLIVLYHPDSVLYLKKLIEKA